MTEILDPQPGRHEEARRVEQLIAAELHDTVCQSLAGSGFFVKVLQGQAERGQPISTADWQKLSALLEEAMADLRAILPVGFNPGGQGLVSSLQNLSKLVSRTAVCELHLESQVDFEDPELGETLFGLVRQAIRYALKKGTGAIFQIRVRQNQSFLKLEVRLGEGSKKVTLSSGELECLRRFRGGIEIRKDRGVLIDCTARLKDQ